MSSTELAETFFEAYLAAPVVVISYVFYKLWKRTPFIRTRNMDLHTGIRDLNISELIAEEKAERATWPKWKRVYKYLC